MQISNEIVLRPRFSQALDINQNKVLELFENAKNSQNLPSYNEFLKRRTLTPLTHYQYP